ncbi:MAG: hypothetical protein PUA48_04745 [Christensenellaceae bacterium]|nr:hypothetical protein [Christensenellaceae bacterium]
MLRIFALRYGYAAILSAMSAALDLCKCFALAPSSFAVICEMQVANEVCGQCESIASSSL